MSDVGRLASGLPKSTGDHERPTAGERSLTVVIPTLGRDPDALRRAVVSAGRVTGEVVVVAQGGGVTPADAERWPVPVSLVQDGGRGASRARNVGLARVATDWVLFLDDDAELLEDAGRVLSGLEREEGVACVSWRVRDGDGHDISRFARAPCAVSVRNHWNLVREHNTVWRTSDLRALGGFDERLGPARFAGAEEAADLMIRLLASGRRARYVPVCGSVHPGAGDMGPAKARQYGRGAGLVIRTHLLRRAAWPFVARTLAGLLSVALPGRFHTYPRRLKWLRALGIAEGLVRRSATRG